jgi:hypothetical protein
MLAKRPEGRFADANAVAEALRGHLHELPMFESPVLESAPIELGIELGIERAVERAVELGIERDVEPDDADDETVVFEAVREWTDMSPMQPLGELELESEPRLARRSKSARVWPKLAAALTMCASLALLSLWAVERDRTRVEAERSSAVESERSLASASQVLPDQPIGVEAVSRVKPAASPSTLAPAPQHEPGNSSERREHSGRKQLGPSKFRAQKDQLYKGVERACTEGGVRRTVKLAVRVDGRGRVEAATVLGKMGASKLGQCVERQARKLEFPATREGGYYVYTLRLRP